MERNYVTVTLCIAKREVTQQIAVPNINDQAPPTIDFYLQEAQLSPSDRAMRLVSSNLANYQATVQKLLIRQVLTKPMVRSWRISWRQCVINKPTTVELCISPVYRRLALAKFFKVHNVEIAHMTPTTPT